MTADSTLPQAISPAAPRWRVVVEVLLIFSVFFLHGAWPVPDVNEPHYLSKAKHYWNKEWCQNDFFVNTADAHQVFYWTFGWLTRFLPLEQVAWVGRLLTWGLLAWAWRRLSWAVVPRAWLAILTAELFVLLNENAHMAGEWVVGGVEAKGFAYVLAFLALEAVVRGRWNWAWLLLGAASGLHVIVGGWATVAAGVAWLAGGQPRPTIRSMLPGLLGGFALALPGLWCALSLTGGADAETVRQANAIYVWLRLPHHLAADRFKEGYPNRHLILWAVWLLLITVAPADAGQRRFRWFISTAMLLTLIGYGLVWLGTWYPDTAAALLRYYWFRTSDVFIPLGVSLAGLAFVDQLGRVEHGGANVAFRSAKERAFLRGAKDDNGPLVRRLWLAGLIAISGYDLWMQTAHLPLSLVDSNFAVVVPRSDKNLAYDDWRKTCAWIKQNTDPQARFFTPRMSATLRWYADRAEVVGWKDIPQDANGIVKWWNRSLDIDTLVQDDRAKWNDTTVLAKGPPPKWLDSLAPLGAARINELAKKYDAQYAIVQLSPDIPRLPAKAVYENGSYAVYKLPMAEK